jgi:DNA repair protein RecO (recombination protein O)
VAAHLSEHDAIVLRLVDVGEADRMATLLAPEGRLELRVPRARGSRRRFGGLDLLAHVTAEVEGGRRLVSVLLQDGRRALRDDVLRLALAGYVAERALQASREGQEAGDLYRLVVAALQALDDASMPVTPAWARGFELKLAHVLGVRPSLRSCVRCGGPLEEDGGTAFSAGEGGVVDGRCRGGVRDAVPLRAATARALDRALHLPLLRQHEVGWTPAMADEAERVLDLYVSHHLAPGGRARRFLLELPPEPAAAPLTSGRTGLMSVAAAAFLGLFSTGCAEEPVTDVALGGWLYDTPWPEEGRPPISGATVSARGHDGALLAEGSEPYSDAPGYYVVGTLPPQTAVHIVLDGVEEHAATVLSGATSESDLWLDPGVLHLWPATSLRAWELESGQSGRAAVRGRLLEPESWVGTRIVLEDAEGQTKEAFAPRLPGEEAGLGTAASGFFFAAGLAPGPLAVRVLRADGGRLPGSFATWAVEGGVTSLMDFLVVE